MTVVLVTGAAGSLGRALIRRLDDRPDVTVVATDVREPPLPRRGVARLLDVRDPSLPALLREHDVGVVVHLAAILSPPPGMSPDEVEDIEIGGTRNVIASAVAAGVGRLVYTSSGAAYGYSPDNAVLLDEDAPLRGDPAFPYGDHKRRCEELLAAARRDHPALAQVVLRVSTVLGAGVHSPITRLFERPVVVGLAGADTPFCFVWDEDVADALEAAGFGATTGVWNLTGDGVMTLREVAIAMGRRYVALPEPLLRRALGALHARGLTENRPEQVAFLRHRPVLDNARIKRELGFVPRKTTRETFALYRAARA